jgi:pimeloyl-ACP methyl ester carboxylesterase
MIPSAYPGAACVRTRRIAVADTTLMVDVRGKGRPLLLIHGGGEDASMLAGQADSLAAAGFQIITYDRRGTGRSGRESWPGSGARQHAADAAELLRALGLGPATVVGLSSGGVIALALTAHHPRRVARVVAWEPPAAGVVPDGDAIVAAIAAALDAHLTEHPGDFIGAQAVLLSAIVGFPVAVDDPAFAATRANAEPMVRDEPTITAERLDPDAFVGIDVTIGLGSQPLDLIAAAARQFEAWTGRPPIVVEGEHEVYLSQPAVLTRLVTDLDARG